MNINFSKLESDRFGLTIYRGTANSIDVEGIHQLLTEKSIDILIFRIPSKNQWELSKLNALNKKIIFADMLVYYSANFNAFAQSAVRNVDIVYNLSLPHQQNTLTNLVEVIFPNYTTHYFSNPLFDKRKILEGYSEWAKGFIDGTSENRFTIMAWNGDLAIGFICLQINPETREMEIILNGVLPEYQSKGVYTDMLRMLKVIFSEKKVSSICVSTQVQNHKVQRCWIREGMAISESFCTIHILN